MDFHERLQKINQLYMTCINGGISTQRLRTRFTMETDRKWAQYVHTSRGHFTVSAVQVTTCVIIFTAPRFAIFLTHINIIDNYVYWNIKISLRTQAAMRKYSHETLLVFEYSLHYTCNFWVRSTWYITCMACDYNTRYHMPCKCQPAIGNPMPKHLITILQFEEVNFISREMRCSQPPCHR